MLDALEVWQPTGAGLDVRVADQIARSRTLAAKFTYASHFFIPSFLDKFLKFRLNT